jgi:16S rRNA (guanine527-N7)-methyltransferase
VPDILSAEAFANRCNVSRETLERLRLYVSLLERWTKSINLVSAESMNDVWRRHILDSAQLLDLMPKPTTSPSTVLDLGSGAGLPGLVLAILGAGHVHLVEADQRKAAFLREAARVTQSTVVIHDRRTEELAAFPVDVVTARALAPLQHLLGYAAPFLAIQDKADGTKRAPMAIFLKGRHVEAELTQARKNWNMAVECVASVSDPGGVVLRITDVHLRGSKA